MHWTCPGLSGLHGCQPLYVRLLIFSLLPILGAEFCRRHIAEHRAWTLVVVKINITANEVILLLDAWLIEPHQRVVLRFHLERAVEALHGVVDVAIGRNKSSCRASPPIDGRVSYFWGNADSSLCRASDILVELSIDNIFVSFNRCVDR